MSSTRKKIRRPLGTALMKQEGIEKMKVEDLTPLIKEELGFEREANMIQKKIEAASDPQTYFDNRKKRQEALVKTVVGFVQEYAQTLRDAGFTVEETGIIARHVAKKMGDIMKTTLDLEYPIEFARKGIEDLLKKKYK